MTDEPIAWIDELTLRVPRDHFIKVVVERMAPDVYQRVQSILNEARHDQIMFAIGSGPYNVSERDLAGICCALDTSGALWKARPTGITDPKRSLHGSLPQPGEWPCQHRPAIKPARLVAFLYVLLRDGAQSPGDVEQHAINAGRTPELVVYTNPHIQAYAEAVAGYLLEEADA